MLNLTENTVIIVILETKGILDTGVIESLAKRVIGGLGEYPSSLPGITCAASLAHHRLLGLVRVMYLWDVDLTSVPAEHLASLASSVRRRVDIVNVRGCGLVTILDSVKSKDLCIRRQSLGREETQALVRLMESGVEEVRLNEEVTLDIWALIEYSGWGKCGVVKCYSDTAPRYREQLRTWATSRNWTLPYEYRGTFSIKRI